MYVSFGEIHIWTPLWTLKKETQLSASGGVVPQDYMNSTWDAAVQKTLGIPE